jgi:hypothetical protein
MIVRKAYYEKPRGRASEVYIMTIFKRDVLKFIEKLPDDYSMDDIMAELYFKQQVEEGLRVAEEGRVYSHEQVKNMVQEWRKSSGRL